MAKSGGGILDAVANTIGAFAGNAFGGPLGAAAVDTGLSALEGGNLKKDLLTGATAGVGSGVSDLLTGAPLTGSGIEGITNALDSAGNTISNIFSPSGGNTIPSSSASIAAPTATPSAGASGGGVGVTGGGAAPASIATDAAATGNLSDQINNQISSFSNIGQIGQNVNNAGSLSDVGSTATSTTNVGTPNISGGNAGTFNYNLSGNPAGSSLSSAANVANATPSSGGLVSNIVSGAENQLSKNPLGIATALGGVGLDLLKGNQQSGAEKNLVAEAGGLANQGNKLQGYLESGTLPPGLQASLNEAADSAKATIRSRYASMGLSGSSAEEQALSQVDIQMQAQSAQMAEQLLTTGINETEGASRLYQALIKDQAAGDAGLSSAITNFASAAAGGGGINSAQLTKPLGAGGAP